MPNQSTALTDWPAIPPVPVPVIPVVPPIAPEPISFLVTPPTRPGARRPSDADLPLLPPPPRPMSPVVAPRPAPPRPMPAPAPEPAGSWRPAFAAVSGAAILVVVLAIALPLWLAAYHTGEVAQVLALTMTVLGTFLAGLASWAMLIELRGKASPRQGGVWSQVAMLVVALGLFVVAAAISLP